MSDLCKQMELLGKGIGNENRYRTLQALMRGPRTVSQVVRAVKCTQPNVSQHLQILKSANLVSSKRVGKEMYYSVNVAHMASLLQSLALDVQKCKKGS